MLRVALKHPGSRVLPLLEGSVGLSVHPISPRVDMHVHWKQQAGCSLAAEGLQILLGCEAHGYGLGIRESQTVSPKPKCPVDVPCRTMVASFYHFLPEGPRDLRLSVETLKQATMFFRPRWSRSRRVFANTAPQPSANRYGSASNGRGRPKPERTRRREGDSHAAKVAPRPTAT